MGRDEGARRDGRRARRVMLAALAAVACAAGLAAWTQARHRRVVRSALGDFATFAAERFTARLDARVQAILFDQLYVARDAHRTRSPAGPAHRDSLPGGRLEVPDGAVRFAFSLDPETGALATRGAKPDPELAAWIRRSVGEHLRTVYEKLPQAPYAGLPRTGEGVTELVVYRREAREDGAPADVFGFVVDLRRLAPLYARLAADEDLLPRGVRWVDEPLELFRLTLSPPGGSEIFRTGPPFPDQVEGSPVSSARAGRLQTRVAFDPERAGLLVPGGVPLGSWLLLGGLFLLAGALLVAALRQAEQERRLVALREAFVANVSHELRTPVAQIRMFAESLLLGRMGDADDRRRGLEVIHREAGHLSDLVENVLVLGRPRAHSGGGSTPARPAAIAREVAEAMAPAAGRREARIEVEGPDALAVDTHPEVVRRSLVNLLDNALKFGPRGQVVRVVVEAVPASPSRPAAVSITVTDEGPGVAPAVRRVIWERFSRGADPAVAGTGLGLAVVRELVTGAGGSVEVRDGAGRRGARFRLLLPAAAP